MLSAAEKFSELFCAAGDLRFRNLHHMPFSSRSRSDFQSSMIYNLLSFLSVEKTQTIIQQQPKNKSRQT